jgi:hypothetical protein
MKTLVVAVAFFVFSPSLLLQNLFANETERSVVLQSAPQQRVVTGNLQIDFFGRNELTPTPMTQDESVLANDQSHKSPWLAAGLSVVLPGAGEFYAESYWKAAAFLAVDITAWVIAYHNDKKGDDQTNFFQNYADQNWSAVQYAQFSHDQFLSLIPQERQSRYTMSQLVPRSTGRPWERVDWARLNEFEREISATSEGKFYSHTLPPYGDQQYFELIGKYQQFYQGWNDADPLLTNYELIDQRLKNGGTKFGYYSIERGKANDYYTRATTFVTIAIVNHVLSALDAAWTASTFNKHLHASMRMQSVPTQFGFTQVPVARLQYSF